MRFLYLFFILWFGVFAFMALMRLLDEREYWDCDKVFEGHFKISEVDFRGHSRYGQYCYIGEIVEVGRRKAIGVKKLNKKLPNVFTEEVRRSLSEKKTEVVIPIYYDTSRYNRVEVGELPWSCREKGAARNSKYKKLAIFIGSLLPILYLIYMLIKSFFKEDTEGFRKM